MDCIIDCITNFVTHFILLYVLGLLYFAFVGRHQLVLSPEEEFALTKGESEYKTY